MGMEFFPKSRETKPRQFWATWRGWGDLYDVAILGGWEPQGTQYFGYYDMGNPHENPPDPDWGGHYFSNDCQFVTAEDARNLADALDRVLLNPPDHDLIEQKDRDALTICEGAENRAYCLEFITFARTSDGFWIL